MGRFSIQELLVVRFRCAFSHIRDCMIIAISRALLRIPVRVEKDALSSRRINSSPLVSQMCVLFRDCAISCFQRRVQELRVFDCRNIARGAEHVELHAASTSILMPFYDEDTQLLFLAAKGAAKLSIVEMNTTRPPLLSLGLHG